MASCGPCSFRLGPGMETRGAELNPGHSQDKSPQPARRLVSSSSRDMEVWGQFVTQHCHRKVNTPSQHPRPHLQSEKHLLTLQPGPAMSHSFFLRSTCFPPRRCSHWSGDRVSTPPHFFPLWRPFYSIDSCLRPPRCSGCVSVVIDWNQAGGGAQ